MAETVCFYSSAGDERTSIRKTPAKKTVKPASRKPAAGKDASKTTTRKASGKHAGGRPSDYNPALHPALAEAWATAGRTDKQIAAIFGVSEATITNWKKAHPEFLASLKKGKEDPDDQVEACLFRRAIGYNYDAVKIFMPAGARAPVYANYIEHCPPDVTAALAWLNNRRPDRWRTRREITGPNGGPVEIASLTPAERKARIEELQARRKA